MDGNSIWVWKVVFGVLFCLVLAFGLFLFFPWQSPALAGGNWQLALILWLPLKLKFAEAMHFLSCSTEEAVTELCHLFIYLFSCLFIFVLIRETSPLAFLLILPELICFAGKEYACVPDPVPECIPLATKRKKKQKGKINQSCTGKELNCIKPNLPMSCATFDSCYVLSLARWICALPDGSVGYTKRKELGRHTHLAHSELLPAPHLTSLKPDWV